MSAPLNEMPRRLGLPLDPVLQVWGGIVSPVSTVTLTGGGADPLIGPDPNRVALVMWKSLGAAEYAVAPAPGPVVAVPGAVGSAVPLLVHCRDYPGVTQGAWVASGMAGNVISVASYSLQPWWT